VWYTSSSHAHTTHAQLAAELSCTFDYLALQLFPLVDGQLADASFDHVHMCQLHQFFLTCDLLPGVWARAGVGISRPVLTGRMRRVYKALRTPARVCFELYSAEPQVSALHQQVANVLCSMHLDVYLEAREARSGYSIDITLHVDTPRPDVLPPPATAPLSYTHTPPHISRTTPHTTTTWPSHTSGPLPLHPQQHLESTSPEGGGGGGKGPVGWVVEVDGPSHYQQHPWGRATGSTQLKRRHLQSLGLALVSIPYWEWNEQAAKGQQACQAYLQAKLALFQGQAGGGERLFPFPLFPESMPLPTDLELRVRNRVPSRSNL